MMPKYWCHNAKTGEIFPYMSAEGITDFPRGTFLAYGDYLTTGLKNRKAAKEWAEEWGICEKCKSVKKPNENGNCSFCGQAIKFVPIKED